MEWYFGNEVEDLVVPRDYEQPEMISSLESWSRWGVHAFGGSDFQKKNFNPNANSNMTREELTFNGGKNFYTSIDMDDCRQKSNNSSMNQGLYNNGGGSLLWNNQADFQQFTEEEARINHMDDLFFSSLLEEDPTKDSTESQDNTMFDNNVNMFEGEMVNSQNVGSHGQSNGSSKYLKTHAFSPSNDWSNEVSTPYEMPEQYANDDNSMEESVLKDLERVTTQFTDKTRICFRDAFYRLAESSKQSVNSCQDGEQPMMTSNDDTLRSRETQVSESETNVIDRAVASLMFNKLDYEDNDHQTDYEDDAEVPIGGMQELAQSTVY